MKKKQQNNEKQEMKNKNVSIFILLAMNTAEGNKPSLHLLISYISQ